MLLRGVGTMVQCTLTRDRVAKCLACVGWVGWAGATSIRHQQSFRFWSRRSMPSSDGFVVGVLPSACTLFCFVMEGVSFDSQVDPHCSTLMDQSVEIFESR